MKPILNKWQFWCKPFGKNYFRVDPYGWHLFDAGFIKIHTKPHEGYMTGKKENYHGFIIRFMWWFPIDRA